MPSSPPHLFPILSLLFFFTSLPLSHSTPLSPSTNVTLFGDAHFANTTISLTPQLNCRSPPSSSPQSLGYGRAFFIAPVQFLDSKTNRTASFSTQFSFAITNPYAPLCPFGEGFTFLITSKTDSFSYGSMGVPNGQDFTYVAVEFDTMLDPNVGDVNDNHVGIDVDSVVSVASVDAFSKGIDLKSGRPLTAWIEYRSGEDTMKVWVGYSQNKPPSPLLVAQIDLSKHLKEFMHVGFSASNGRGSAIHLVGQWKFKTYGLFPSVMPMETVNGGGGDCLMCSSPGELGGQNSNANYHHINKRLRELALGIGGLAAFIISLSAILVIVIWCMIRKRRLNSRGSNEGQVYQGNKLPKRLSLSAIRSATKGFNHNRIIGEGGSATVYKGSLPSCGPVAVKRFSQVSQISIFRNQFSTEFTTMMGCLKHKHLVQLQGWCCEEDELVLVYQYMPNGSLDKILHRNNNAMSLLLVWDRRVKIVLGVASALIYLHEECERQIIHRDVKTCNIMLDDELNAKLGDFGLAEIYEHSCRTRDATIPAGTMGYLAPEYVYLGVPTVKTDVYSFGVVVLEVASGKRPVNEEGTLLADYMWEVWGKGKLMEAADSRLRGKYNKLEMERMLMVGLCCVHPDYEKRPTVREAATMIRGEAPLPVLPMRKPSVSIRSGFPGEFDEFMNFCRHENFDFDDTPPWLTPESHF